MAEQQNKKVILIAVDGSTFSANAFNWYVQKLRTDNDDVVFIHVPESYDFWQTSQAEKEDLVDDIEKHVKDVETKYNELVTAAGIHNAKFRTRAGKPGEQVVKLAKELDAHYIICGTRGLGTIRRTILGSVSDFIVHHAGVPVLVYRQN